MSPSVQVAAIGSAQCIATVMVEFAIAQVHAQLMRPRAALKSKELPRQTKMKSVRPEHFVWSLLTAPTISRTAEGIMQNVKGTIALPA